MGAGEPIPLRKHAESYGRKAGEWTRQARERAGQGRELLESAQKFWREIQTPRGRRKFLLPLLGAAFGAGLLLGFLTRRRD